MKKMKLRMMIALLAASAAVLSGCAANETKTADSAETSAVSAHETTEDTKVSESTAAETVSEDETDVEETTSEPEKQEEMPETEITDDVSSEVGDTDEEEDPEDTSEDAEDPEDEEGGELEFSGKMSPIDAATYPCSVILVSVEENTGDDKINELLAKYGLGIVYDYENFNMYAFSTPEPLDKEATKKLLDELMSYDFILIAEPDQIIQLDDPVEPDSDVIDSFRSEEAQ